MALTAGIFTLSSVIALIVSLATGQFHALWGIEPGLPEMAMFAHAAILSMCFFGLYELIRRTVRDDSAEAVVVGGGPLADAARTLAPTSPVPLIEPVPAAVRRLVAALSQDGVA